MNIPGGSVVQRWLAAVPDAVDRLACRDSQQALSHAQFLDLARCRAARLAQDGFEPEARVVVALSSGADQAVWIAAVFLAGGCAVPLGLHQPPDRLSELVELARPTAVVTDAGTRMLGRDRRAYDGADPGSDDHFQEPTWPAERAAYICFTSGTTGQPKGAIVTHGVLAHTTAAMADYLHLATRPRTHVLATSWSFDVAMMDLWLALSTGGTLFVPDRNDLLGPALFDTVAPLLAPIVHGVPSLFAACSDGDLDRLPAGTTVMLGGEAVPPRLLRGLADRIDMHVVYGITETGVITTTYPIGPDAMAGVIGTALPGVPCIVVNDDLEPVPPDTAGELLIGGPAVGRGYLDAPGPTAAKFVPAPDGGRWYRTGDLVRRAADGAISFQGRIDHQVKIRGHRIEPAEVEAVLLSLPGVRQAVVVPANDPTGELRLVAYLGGDRLDRETVRAAVAARLPEWMCPTVIEILDALPVTVTGKVDRKQLPPPPWQVRDVQRSTGGDRTAMERAVGGLWEYVLGTEHVAPDDNFVALGGHSLKAAQLSTALRDSFGVSVSVPEVLAAQSLRALTGLIDASRRGAAVETSTPSDVASAQERQMWLHQQLADNAGIYNLVVTVDLRGPLNITALQRALIDTERRHAALRSRFTFDGDRLVVTVEPPADRPLAIRHADVAEAVRRAGATAIDVATEPPWRYEVLIVDANHHVLLVTVHHIVLDGFALYRILTEIGESYSAIVMPGRPAPERSSSRRAPEQAADRPEDVEFWTRMLTDAPVPVALTGYVGVSITEFEGWCRPICLVGIDPARVRAAAAVKGVSQQALMLAAFLRAIGIGSDDLVIGVPISHRGVDAEPDAIGQYASVLPVRFTIPGTLSADERIKVVLSTINRVRQHAALDPATIVELARPRPDGGLTDPFRVVFAWEDEVAVPNFARIESSWRLEFNGWSEVDLTIELAVRDGIIAGRAVGRLGGAAEADVDGLVAAIVAEVREIIDEASDRRAPSGVAGLEKVIADVWRELLGVPEANATDSFFALGGRSLDAMRAVTRIRERSGRRITLADLFRTPVLRDLAGVLHARSSDG